MSFIRACRTFTQAMAKTAMPEALGKKLVDHSSRIPPCRIEGWHGTQMSAIADQIAKGFFDRRGRLYFSSSPQGFYGAVRFARNRDDSVLVRIGTNMTCDVDMVKGDFFFDNSEDASDIVYIKEVYLVSSDWKDRVYGRDREVPSSLMSRILSAAEVAIREFGEEEDTRPSSPLYDFGAESSD